jgi:DNA helicase-2/ATP-dependent DNA helicase PcrA
MTLHLAKGLEFPIVFLTGMEEGLLPHHKSRDSVSGVEEERRLCYVGITRAKKKIYLTYTNRRGMFSAGSSFGTADGWREASRFLQDIPNCFLEPWIINEHRESLPDDQLHLAHSSKVITSNANKGIILATADQLLESSAKTKRPQQIDELEPLSNDAVIPGTKVFHPTFGQGVIESVTGDCCEDPQRAKVRIQFDCFQGTKTLIFGKSKLRRINNPKQSASYSTESSVS